MTDRSPDAPDSAMLAHQWLIRTRQWWHSLWHHRANAEALVKAREELRPYRKLRDEMGRDMVTNLDAATIRGAPGLQHQTLANVREREADEPCKCQVCIDWYSEDGRPGTSPEPVTKPEPPQWADASQKLEARNIADAERREREAKNKAANEDFVTRAIGPPNGANHE